MALTGITRQTARGVERKRPADPTASYDVLGQALAAARITKVAGVNRDASSGHGSRPWRSAVRKTDARGDFELQPAHDASWAGAVHRILKAYQDNDVRDANGRFLLAPGKTVDAAQLASLVDAARQQAADGSSRCLTGGAIEPPATGGALRDSRFVAPRSLQR